MATGPCGSKLLVAPHRRGRSLAAQEALAAINGAALGGLERNRGLAPALRARGHGFRFGKTPTPRTLALLFASLAALGFVLEILIVEEVLFSRCEDEVRSTVSAF
jgi:hypothetical protein